MPACCSEVKCLFVGCICCCLLETNLNGKKPSLFGCSDFWLLITFCGVYAVFCGQCWRTASFEQEQCLADCLLDCFCHCGCCGLCLLMGVMKLIQQNEGQQEHVHQQQPQLLAPQGCCKRTGCWMPIGPEPELFVSQPTVLAFASPPPSSFSCHLFLLIVFLCLDHQHCFQDVFISFSDLAVVLLYHCLVFYKIS